MSISKIIELKPDEKIIVVCRQYGLTYFFSIILSFILLVLPFFLMAPLFSFGIFGMFTFFVLLGVGLFYSLRKLIIWYYNIFIVTDRRVVDVDQRGFFDRVVSSVSFSKIQDVSYRIKGILPTVFRFGKIVVQISGGSSNIELKRIKNPQKIIELINELREGGLGVEEKEGNSLENLMKGISDDEVKMIISEVKRKSRDEATKSFFSNED